MALSMSSLWEFNSTVKLKVELRSCGQYNRKLQHWEKCSSQGMNFVEVPSSVLLGTWNSNKVRRSIIPLATESSKAASGFTSAEPDSFESSVTTDKVSPSISQPSINGNEETSSKMEKPLTNRPSLTAREKLRAARVISRYNEPKPNKARTSSRLLDSLKESDKGKQRSGLPEAPTNLLDDSKRGLSKQTWTFNLPGGSDLYLIAFSFVFISTVMFATTYVVWKVGAIHFNEY